MILRVLSGLTLVCLVQVVVLSVIVSAQAVAFRVGRVVCPADPFPVIRIIMGGHVAGQGNGKAGEGTVFLIFLPLTLERCFGATTSSVGQDFHPNQGW